MLKGNTRTFGSVEDLFWSFCDSGIVIHPAMVSGETSTPIMMILPPPELHLLLGLVNNLVDSMIAV